MKGVKGEPALPLSAPSLNQPLSAMTVNKSQTAILKYTVEGNPSPQVSWSKVKESFTCLLHLSKKRSQSNKIVDKLKGSRGQLGLNR